MTATYCTTCDAEEGKCEHVGTRYLGEISYERVTMDSGQRVWRAPESEREDWERRRGVDYSPVASTRMRPLDQLAAMLDRVTFVSSSLRRKIGMFYELEPERCTRMVEHGVESATDGSMNAPGAWIEKQLREEGIT